MAPSPYADIHREFATARQVSPDGWMSRGAGSFRFFRDREPPRPYPYAVQIRRDLRSWTIWAFFGMPLLVSALLAYTGEWTASALFLLGIVGIYVVMLYDTVRTFRNVQVLRGRITSYTDHPARRNLFGLLLFKGVRSARAQLEDERTVETGLDMPEMCELLDEGHALDVLLLYTSPKTFGLIFAYRIVDRDPSRV